MLFPKYYTTYLITITQRHGHILSILRHLRHQWPWTSLRGHPKSLTLAPIKSAYGTSYWTSIVTLVLSCRVSEILQLLYAESFFPHRTSIPAKLSGVPLGVSAKSEHPRLTIREIIFEEFHMWSRYLNVTDRQTERQTGRRLAVTIPRSM